MKNRKRNRMSGFDYSSNNLYFITNCVKNNLCCFGNVIPVGTGRDLSVQHPDNNSQNIIMQLNEYGAIVKNKIEWLELQYPYVAIHNYVIMPNHFHLILEIDSNKIKVKEVKIKSVSSLMGALKTTTSKQIHNLGFVDFAWHRSFHDHIIRDEKQFFYITSYIDNNPQKWFQDKFFNALK
ncbi:MULTISPECIES: transposase [Flavobacterium]|uniref:Transposase n=1 Tax=Flavobacterium hankyongi TaxID=1176532 RepID=A0ABP9A0U2_9FLAO|nr:transposase [Flavobacterium sp. N1846]